MHSRPEALRSLPGRRWSHLWVRGRARGFTEGARAGSSSVTSPAEGRFSSEELQRRWWTWAASEPERVGNPVADQDGSSCGRNQPRDVWFLAGFFGGQVERTCSVPGGVHPRLPRRPRRGALRLRRLHGVPPRGRQYSTSKRIKLRRNAEGRRSSCGVSPTTPSADAEAAFMATGCRLSVQLEPLECGSCALTIRW